jgi:hypothetical protein
MIALPVFEKMAPNDPVQLDHERRIRRLEEARLVVENTLLAMIELDRREAAKSEQHAARMAHLDQTMIEIGDKLNGLIGWADGTVKKKPPKKRNGHKQ